MRKTDALGREIGSIERMVTKMRDSGIIKLGGWQITHLKNAILRELPEAVVAEHRRVVNAFLIEAAVRGLTLPE